MAVNPIGAISGFLGQQSGGRAPGVGSYNPLVSGDVTANNPGLQPVPGQPGRYYDPSSGQIVVQDPNTGQVAVDTGANANQLTALDTSGTMGAQQTQQQMLGRLGANLTNENGAIADYTNTITNPNAPSVAGTQLQQGLNAVAGRQEAIAAGATGENQPNAQRTMAQNIAGAGIAETGQQAALRAQEVQNAQAGRSTLLANQANNLGQLYSAAGSEGVGYANNATTNQGNVLNANTSNDQFNAKQNKDLLGGIGSAVSAIGAM